MRTFRKKNDLSLNDLARKTGIAASNLSSIELSKTSPTLTTLIRIAEAFNLRVGAFLDDVLYEKAYFCSHSGETGREAVSETSFFRRISPEVPQLSMAARVFTLKEGSSDISLNGKDTDRLLYCVEGKVRVSVDREIFDMEAGDSVYVLPGASVTVRSHEGPDARLLVVESLSQHYGAGT